MRRIFTRVTSIAAALLICLNMFPAIAFAQSENAATENVASASEENLNQGDVSADCLPMPLIHTVSGTASPAEGGTVTGGGKVIHTGFTGLLATANPGYTFVRWTEDGVEAGTDRLLMIYCIMSDHNYVAEFAKQTFTISASADPVDGGTITGTGIVEYGDSATLTATTNSGYTFSRWTECGVEVGTSATLEINNITADHDYVAVFTKDSTEPVDPIEPVDPVDPTEPEDPTDPTKPADPKPTDPTETINTKTNTAASANTATAKAAKTGDQSPITGLLLLTVFAGSALVVTLRRRESLDK